MAVTTLRRGSRGDSVKSLQKKLGIKADGIFGKQTEAAVRAYQSKNSLTSDGIVGAKTNARLSGGSSRSINRPYSNTKMSKPGQKMTYASSLPKVIPTINKKNNSNSPLGMFANWLKTKKDSITTGIGGLGSSAQKNKLNANGTPYEPFYNFKESDYQIKPKETGASNYVAPTPFEVVSSFGGQVRDKITDVLSKAGDTVVDKLNSTTTYGSQTDNPTTNLQNMDLSLGLPKTPAPVVSDDINKPSGHNSLIPEANIIDNGTVDNGTTKNGNSGGMYGAYNTISKNNTIGVKTSDIGAKTWGDNLSGNEFTGQNTISYPKQVANLFQDFKTADDWFNNDPEGKVAKADLEKKGYTVQDVLQNISTKTNGIKPPQTWSEYDAEIQKLSLGDQKEYIDYMNSKVVGINPAIVDTKGMSSELKTMAEAQNKMIIEQSKFLNEQQKMTWTNSYLDSIEAEKEIRVAEEMLLKRETAIEDRLNFNTKKMKAEMKAQEAEDEKARINGMNYMSGYLAKIGALDVSSSAAFGLNALETKYQEQKSANRQKYLFAIEEMELDANDKINNLRYDLEKSKLEISRDLTKDERQVRADMFKLNYDYKIDALKVNTNYQEKLMEMKEKQKSDSTDLSEKWIKDLFDLSGWNQFNIMDEDYQNTWLENVIKGKKDKDSWVNQLKPGSISKSNVDKSAEDFYGGSSINNNDPLGVL